MPFMKKGGGFFREVQLLGQPCQNRPAEFARSSLSACGLPTPIVALVCIGYSNLASPERGGGPAKLVEGFFRKVYFLRQPCRNRPAEFARSSLSACGLPTPVVALACIGNVDIQVLSSAGG